MTPAQMQGQYARMLQDTATLQRDAVQVAGVPCRVMAVTDAEMVDVVQQSRRRVILLAAPVLASALGAVRLHDEILWSGKTLVVTGVDDATRAVAGVLVAYDLIVEGA